MENYLTQTPEVNKNTQYLVCLMAVSAVEINKSGLFGRSRVVLLLSLFMRISLRCLSKDSKEVKETGMQTPG